ncbi:50S ribosomal protein L4 [Candidatus Woesebacteria bacterium]|nr:50S ribosomal protein L4 [Candidatus Woesebacteria bacterium]
MKAKVYTSKGMGAGTVNLPKQFKEKENLQLLAQAIRVYEDKRHQGTSKVKTRAQVAISKRKIYRQKHTGRARHGAKSAPIFIGGGVAHGPKGIKRELVLPKKMKAKARSVALSIKARQGQVVTVSSLSKIQKTKDAQALFDKIFAKEFKDKKPSQVTIALADANKDRAKVFRNMEETKVILYKDLNAFDVFFGGLLIIDKEVFEKSRSSRTSSKSSKK